MDLKMEQILSAKMNIPAASSEILGLKRRTLKRGSLAQRLPHPIIL
jgi:hypothetical protein